MAVTSVGTPVERASAANVRDGPAHSLDGDCRLRTSATTSRSVERPGGGSGANAP